MQTKSNNKAGGWKWGGAPGAVSEQFYKAGAEYTAWTKEWAEQALRVMKPGGYMLCFGGTRTWHRLACGLEDAGWQLRDTLMWLYGSGFPKSLNIALAIEKQQRGHPQGSTDPVSPNHGKLLGGHPGAGPGNWQKLDSTGSDTDSEPRSLPEAYRGLGTALKPAWEPILLCRKPCEGTVADTVQTWGTGGLNIESCRIEFVNEQDEHEAKIKNQHEVFGSGPMTNQIYGKFEKDRKDYTAIGRWPANVILDEEAGALLDQQAGEHPGCRSPSKAKPQSKFRPQQGEYMPQGQIYPDSGGVSRFFYCAKASRSERSESNNHPTVKPLALMRYLVRLITPTGGTTCDPFAGSGSTLVAAALENRSCVGIEKEAEYITIAKARLSALHIPVADVY